MKREHTLAGLEVVPVRSRAALRDFVAMPWALYDTDPNWVPPLKAEQARLLTPGKHPFWDFSERELFLARRGADIVGRIAAIVDGNYHRYRDERMGAWGFFECRQDPEAAVALFAAAEKWLREKGVAFMRGPLNPSTNYEAGLLIQGFDSPPTLMMTYNPPYYAELVSCSGFRKEKDLLAYGYSVESGLPDWAVELSAKLTQRGDVRIRTGDRRHLASELQLMNRIYNECWSNNWGFAPMTDDEIRETARSLIHIADMDLAFFLYYKDEPVGVSLLIPDVNPLLKRFDGRGGLSALIKKHVYWSDVTGLRGVLFGVKEAYRQMGLPLVALDYLIGVIKRKKQYRTIELGWNLEDNHAINTLYEEGGLKPTKRYRLYRKDLS